MNELEPHLFREEPTESLVARYTQLQQGSRPEWKQMPQEMESQLEGACQEADKLVKSSQADGPSPEELEARIVEIYGNLIEAYPHETSALFYIQLYDQARVWIGDSVRELKDKGGVTSKFITSQERAARLIMMDELIAGFRTPIMGKMAFSALFNSGRKKEALFLAEKCFSGLVFSKNPEEGRMMARSLGERDEAYIKMGIAVVDPAKPSFRNN